MSDILCRFATVKEHQSFSNGEITGGQFVFVYLRDGGELHAVVQFLFIITKTLKGSIHLEVPEFCSDWRGTTLILDVNCILKALKHDHKRKI